MAAGKQTNKQISLRHTKSIYNGLTIMRTAVSVNNFTYISSWWLKYLKRFHIQTCEGELGGMQQEYL